MDQFLAPLVAFVETNHDYAGPVLALLTLGESLLIIGIIIPASVVMLVMGGLMGSGMVDPVSVLLWGIAGAIVGDAISYFFGRWMGYALLHTWPLKHQRRAVARARLLFMRHGAMAVFVGRFLGPLRAVAPTMAGMMKMSQRRFHVANVTSAIVWLPLMLLPGYITGRGMQSMDPTQIGIVVVSLCAIVALVLVARSLLRRRRLEQRL